MCHFISAVIPHTADSQDLTALARAHHKKLEPFENPSITKQLHSNERLYLTTASRCDCGSPLVSWPPAQAPDLGKLEAKLKRKGWTDSKVARSLAQQAAHDSRRDTAAIDAERPDLENWHAFLVAALNSERVPYVGLMVHSFTGPMDGPVTLRGRRAEPLPPKPDDLLGFLQEDWLYEICRTA